MRALLPWLGAKTTIVTRIGASERSAACASGGNSPELAARAAAGPWLDQRADTSVTTAANASPVTNTATALVMEVMWAMAVMPGERRGG